MRRLWFHTDIQSWQRIETSNIPFPCFRKGGLQWIVCIPVKVMSFQLALQSDLWHMVHSLEPWPLTCRSQTCMTRLFVLPSSGCSGWLLSAPHQKWLSRTWVESLGLGLLASSCLEAEGAFALLKQEMDKAVRGKDGPAILVQLGDRRKAPQSDVCGFFPGRSKLGGDVAPGCWSNAIDTARELSSNLELPHATRVSDGALILVLTQHQEMDGRVHLRTVLFLAFFVSKPRLRKAAVRCQIEEQRKSYFPTEEHWSRQRADKHLGSPSWMSIKEVADMGFTNVQDSSRQRKLSASFHAAVKIVNQHLNGFAPGVGKIKKLDVLSLVLKDPWKPAWSSWRQPRLHARLDHLLERVLKDSRWNCNTRTKLSNSWSCLKLITSIRIRHTWSKSVHDGMA